MATKKIILIDEDKCVGCEQCVDACPGGALAMVDGKAKVVRQDFCDGLGVCIGECPVDAITFKEVPIEATEEVAEPCGCPSSAHKTISRETVVPIESPEPTSPCGCPGGAHKTLKQVLPTISDPVPTNAPGVNFGSTDSELNAWPIQLHLIRPEAPQFQGADVLIAASCSAFSCGSFHPDLLKGKALIIACPKLDRLDGYVEKLTALFQNAKPKSVTVARMEVPCCMGLTKIVGEARAASGADTPVSEIVVGLDGRQLTVR